MSSFWSLLKESVILQGILTLAIWGAIIYLEVTGSEASEILIAGGMAILGFYFGAKSQNVIQNRVP